MANLPFKKDPVIVAAIKIMRPVHWVKNLSLFAAILLTGLLYAKGYFVMVFWAFIAFNLATSATYIFNDILDAKHDRLHPVKRNRPIASGSLPIPLAFFEAFLLALFSILIASSLNHLFFLLVSAYLALQLFYSLGLKKIPIVDILIIASGFIIRVYAGASVINAHLSVWFLLCVISVALFLASGKRRAELNILKETNEVTRDSLTKYKRELLNSYVTMFGNAAWVSWALYSFFESPKASQDFWLVLAEISRTTTINKFLMVTIPIVIFGIMRYEALIFEGKSEAPEKVLLTDPALLISAALWVGVVYLVLYGGISTV